MKPIISPWTIYFASRADSLKILAGCILICCIIAICIAFIEGDIDYGSVLTHKSFMKKCAIVSVISAVTLVITPSTKTIYTMAVVNEITPDWGRYLLQNVDRYIYKNPDVMIYGNDDSRSGWFDKKDLKNTTELIINREELPISGTMLRALMIQDKRREWMTFVNPKLHKMYDEIRSELMESIKEN